MPLDYTNPQTLRFITENVEKEQIKRMRWFINNKDDLIKRAEFPDTYKEIRTAEVTKFCLGMYMDNLSKEHNSYTGNRRTKPIRDVPTHESSQIRAKLKSKPKPGTESSVPEFAMLPVEPNIEKIRYERLPFGGRRQYLKARNRLDPEDKYYYDVTSSNSYAWGWKDSKGYYAGPSYGRYCAFNHDLMSRSGPQSDPVYYNKPPRDPYSKCPI